MESRNRFVRSPERERNLTLFSFLDSNRASSTSSTAAMQNAVPIEIVQPEDITNAVAWLVSDEAKFITGVALPLDAGFTVR